MMKQPELIEKEVMVQMDALWAVMHADKRLPHFLPDDRFIVQKMNDHGMSGKLSIHTAVLETLDGKHTFEVNAKFLIQVKNQPIS